MSIRQAKLDDTQAISDLHRLHIQAWQRLDITGHVEDVPYDALTIYERWLHGGAWMSPETGAVHLNHLLRGAGIPLVAEVDGKIVAYTELYESTESPPFGHSLSLNHPTIHPDQVDNLLAAILDAARNVADEQACERLLVQVALPEAAAFYQQQGLQPLATVRRYSLPAKMGQGFYRTTEHPDDSAKQITGWQMPIGRLASPRQQWEMLWPDTWSSIPEIAARPCHRLKFNAAGQEAFVCCQQQLYAERNANLYCWSPRPLTSQLLTAIRDWSHRAGYRTLVLAVLENAANILGTEAESDGYSQTIYASQRDADLQS